MFDAVQGKDIIHSPDFRTTTKYAVHVRCRFSRPNVFQPARMYPNVNKNTVGIPCIRRYKILELNYKDIINIVMH